MAEETYTLDGTEFALVFGFQDADYSWSAEAVLRRVNDGALFFVTDGGCSCNGFGEYLSVADLQPIRRAREALKLTSDRPAMQRAIDASGWEWRD